MGTGVSRHPYSTLPVDILGHSSITLISNTYGHVLEQRQRQVGQGGGRGAGG